MSGFYEEMSEEIVKGGSVRNSNARGLNRKVISQESVITLGKSKLALGVGKLINQSNFMNRTQNEWCRRYLRSAFNLLSKNEVLPERLTPEVYESSLAMWMNFVNQNIEKLRELHKPPKDHIFPTNFDFFPFFPLGNQHLERFHPLDYLNLVKVIRPDLLSYCLEAFLPEVKNKAYYMFSRNLVSHSRYNWYNKATFLFYNELDRNPADYLEILAARNLKSIVRINFGRSEIPTLQNDISRAAGTGLWLLLENFHLLSERKMIGVLKDLIYFLERSKEGFKIWIMLFTSSKSVDFRANMQQHPSFLLFLRNSQRIFLTRSENLQKHLLDYYFIEDSDLKQEVEKEIEKKLLNINNERLMNASMNPGGSKPPFQGKSFLREFGKIRHESIKAAFSSKEGLQSIWGLKEEKLPNIFTESARKWATLAPSLKYQLLFFMSALKERSKLVRELIGGARTETRWELMDADLSLHIDDIIDSHRDLILEPLTFLVKYLRFIVFDESDLNSPVSSPILIYSFFTRVIGSLSNLPKLEPESQNPPPTAFKVSEEISYLFPRVNEFKFRTFHDSLRVFPAKDPLQLFGFKPNDEMLLNYLKSKKQFKFFFNHVKHLGTSKVVGHDNEDLEGDQKDIEEEQFENETILYYFECITRALGKFGKKFESSQKEFGVRNQKRMASSSSINFAKMASRSSLDPQPKEDNFQILDVLDELIRVIYSLSFEVIQSFKIDYQQKTHPLAWEKDEIPALGLIEHPSFSQLQGVKPPSIREIRINRAQSNMSIDSPKMSKINLIKNEESESNEQKGGNLKRKASRDFEKSMASIISTSKKWTSAQKLKRKYFLNDAILFVRISQNLQATLDELRTMHSEAGIPPWGESEVMEAIERRFKKVVQRHILATTVMDVIVQLLESLDFLHTSTVRSDWELAPVLNLEKGLDITYLFLQEMISKSSLCSLPLSCFAVSIRPVGLAKINLNPEEEEKSHLYLSGLKIRGGTLNEETGFLEDEGPREFIYMLETSEMEVVWREKPKERLDHSPSYPILMKAKRQDIPIEKMEAEFYEETSNEIYGDSLDFTEPEEIGKTDEKRKRVYVVRLPLVVGKKKSERMMNTQFYVYFLSYKNQAHWLERASFVTNQSLRTFLS